MPELQIRQGLWEEIVAIAEKQKQKPESLVQQVLRDYVQRFTDEELLEQSSTATRRVSFGIDESEEVIRRYRKKHNE